MHQQKTNKHVEEKMEKGAVPAYLLDREQTRRYDNKLTTTLLPSFLPSLSPLLHHAHMCLRVACWAGD